MENLRIVGTSHIARDSVREIRRAYEEFAPDVIAVELDPGRLHALVTNAKPSRSPAMIREIGLKGYLFALIGGAMQRRLGDVVGVSPGSDMLAAVRLARRDQKPLLLIDQDLRVTLFRLNRSMGWPELRQFCRDVWDSLFHKERVAIDLAKVPGEALVAKLLGLFAARYPRPYQVLVAERNVHMANQLQRYRRQQPEQKILVVVGAGHVAGMRALLD